ncbi:putative rhamnosyl transferase [Paracoccus laeviglucosivorans]|uniref:Rhamnosyl transferase n=1 Tax=Paracoccus laeviglucosivorans TaxID=1197861 RepID=A0A521EXM7_9RHOB|nr:putative rhamnosyl transferase [Paracoccus laeviglucosivorans]SMO88161.1 Putative rhamnosyl transferase [Paracoccus laeviglucosivorans]
MRVQMLGLCRFSYLGGRGFQVSHQTVSERRAFLYDPARLARRWHWFENVTLPGLLAQTDQDFTMVLMTGPDLPDPYMSQLRELTEIAPQFKLALIPPIEAHLDACMQAITPYIEPQADVVGHFRQDDDDAVAVDYIRDARRDFAAMRPLWKQRGRLSCDYSRGLVLKATQKGISVEPRIIYNAVAGLTIYLPPDAQRSVMHFPHWKIGLSMPGVNMPSKVMFVRFLNHDNDSGAIGAGYQWDVTDPDWRTLLAERFCIDLPSLEQAARAFALPGADRPRWGV